MKNYRSAMKPLVLAVVGLSLSGGVGAVSTITDLGTLGGTQSRALGINNSGVVVGRSGISTSSSFQQAFVNNGSMVNIHSGLGVTGGDSTAWAINDSGQVTGYARTTSTGPSSGFRYTSGTATLFNSLLSADRSFGVDINSSGDVAGYYYTTTPVLSSFRYSASGVMTTLPTLGGTNGQAFGINDNGDIVGTAEVTGNTAWHAFHYSGGTMTDIGTLGGLESVAREINNSGTIVGMSMVSLLDNDIEHPFVYSGGVMTDIGTFGGIRGIAYAINSVGDVVGRATTAAEETRAFLYSGGILFDLNDLLPPGSGWVLTEANDINDEGEVVGIGRINGEDHAYVMNPGC